MIIPGSPLTAKQQATVFTTGYVVVIFVGILASVALCFAALFAALWLVAQLALIVVQTVTECAATVTVTYQSSDPLIKFCFLAVSCFVVYRVVTRLARR